MNHKPFQIIILGAGYSGLMTALRLSGKTKNLNANLALVDASPTFIQRPRLHHVATNQPILQKQIDELIRGTSIDFVQGWISRIELD